MRHISNIGDLSNNSIESLYQDHKGQLWIGTCDGLNAFNGRDIYIYRPTDNNKRLSGNIIDNILETTNNTLWVQTYHGLNKIERITQDVTHYNDFNESLLMLKIRVIHSLFYNKTTLLNIIMKKRECFKLPNFAMLYLKYTMHYYRCK